MGRLNQRRTGPRRRLTGAEPVRNPFQALDLVSDPDADPVLIASAKRLQNRRRLDEARRDLATPEPDPKAAGLHAGWMLRRQQAGQVVAWARETPGDFWPDGREPGAA